MMNKYVITHENGSEETRLHYVEGLNYDEAYESWELAVVDTLEERFGDGVKVEFKEDELNYTVTLPTGKRYVVSGLDINQTDIEYYNVLLVLDEEDKREVFATSFPAAGEEAAKAIWREFVTETEKNKVEWAEDGWSYTVGDRFRHYELKLLVHNESFDFLEPEMFMNDMLYRED